MSKNLQSEESSLDPVVLDNSIRYYGGLSFPDIRPMSHKLR